jgi:hypothetical protein
VSGALLHPFFVGHFYPVKSRVESYPSSGVEPD